MKDFLRPSPLPWGISLLPLLISSAFAMHMPTERDGNGDNSKGIIEDIFGPIGSRPQATPTGVKEARCGAKNPLNPGLSYKIQSPFFGFPFGNYPPSFNCAYEFFGTDGCDPLISCSDFKVVQSNNCSSDYLEVADGVGGSQRYCGTEGPKSVSSGISIMRVRFQSGIIKTDKGFKCIISCAANTTSDSNPAPTLISNALGKPETVACNCGEPGPNRRIVGGTNAVPEYWTWQAALVIVSRNSPFCGGALINDRFILTAAHCVVTTGLVGFPALAEVVLNEYDTSTTNDTKTIRRRILNITPHPFYDTTTQDYDVSVIEFYPPLNLTSKEEPRVTPVCLPPRGTKTTFAGVNGTATGWGTLTEGGDQATVLQQADIPIITNEACNRQYSNKITPRMICAAYPEGGIDSCQGDSGGPFVVGVSSAKRFMEVGVVSFGEGCARADKPGVYARVTDLNDWIRQTAWRGAWCNE